MAVIQLTVNLGRSGLLEKLERFDSIVNRVGQATENVAMESLGRLVNATPVRYTHHTRKSWVHRKFTNPNIHVLANPYKVMHFLEHGTRAHGPVNAKALFIPLNKKAFHAGPKQIMQANAAAIATGQWRNYTARASGGRGRRVRLPWQVGVDYLFVKRVKGIRAHHIAKQEQARVTRQVTDVIKEALIRELS